MAAYTQHALHSPRYKSTKTLTSPEEEHKYCGTWIRSGWVVMLYLVCHDRTAGISNDEKRHAFCRMANTYQLPGIVWENVCSNYQCRMATTYQLPGIVWENMGSNYQCRMAKIWGARYISCATIAVWLLSIRGQRPAEGWLGICGILLHHIHTDQGHLVIIICTMTLDPAREFNIKLKQPIL